VCVFSLCFESERAKKNVAVLSLSLSLRGCDCAHRSSKTERERERELENFLSKRRSLSFGKKKNLERSHFDKDRERATISMKPSIRNDEAS